MVKKCKREVCLLAMRSKYVYMFWLNMNIVFLYINIHLKKGIWRVGKLGDALWQLSRINT